MPRAAMQPASFEEAAAQWAAAHRIVVTKADAVPDGALAQARSEIAALNPLAEIVATPSRGEAVAAAFAPLAGRAAMPALPRAAATAATHPRIAVRLARPAGILDYDALAAWLDNLAGALGERLLRLKGLVRVAESERPVLVQSVGTSFSAPRPFGAPRFRHAALSRRHCPRPRGHRTRRRPAGGPLHVRFLDGTRDCRPCGVASIRRGGMDVMPRARSWVFAGGAPLQWRVIFFWTAEVSGSLKCVHIHV